MEKKIDASRIAVTVATVSVASSSGSITVSSRWWSAGNAGAAPQPRRADVRCSEQLKEAREPGQLRRARGLGAAEVELARRDPARTAAAVQGEERGRGDGAVVLEGPELRRVGGDGGQVVAASQGQPAEGRAGDVELGQLLAGLERQVGEARARGDQPLHGAVPAGGDPGQVSDGSATAAGRSSRQGPMRRLRSAAHVKRLLGAT